MDKCDTCLHCVFKACKRVQAMAWTIIILPEEKMSSEGSIGWGGHNLSKVSKNPREMSIAERVSLTLSKKDNLEWQ